MWRSGKIVLADCEECGERDHETLAEQWSGRPVPPWNDGKPPRCGFCGHPLTRRPGPWDVGPPLVLRRCHDCGCDIDPEFDTRRCAVCYAELPAEFFEE